MLGMTGSGAQGSPRSPAPIGRAVAVALVTVATLGGVATLGSAGAIRVGGVYLPLLAAAIALLLNWVAFVPAAMRRTERFYDLVGALSYLSVVGVCVGALASAGALSWVHLVVASMVAVWSGRLGWFLVRRVHRVGRDGRFDEMKQQPARFFVAWTLQALWVFLTALPAIVLLSRPAAAPDAFTLVGWAMWAAGLAIEIVADAQKGAFAVEPSNRGRFITTGLWAWSRHPNYFGEILLWTGVFVSGIGSWHGTLWVTALSPVFVTLLLTKISGVPLLEARADARWGGDPAYEAYKANTPVLVPRPPRARPGQG